jgi:hypothetical protein
MKRAADKTRKTSGPHIHSRPVEGALNEFGGFPAAAKRGRLNLDLIEIAGVQIRSNRGELQQPSARIVFAMQPGMIEHHALIIRYCDLAF